MNDPVALHHAPGAAAAPEQEHRRNLGKLYKMLAIAVLACLSMVLQATSWLLETYQDELVEHQRQRRRHRLKADDERRDAENFVQGEQEDGAIDSKATVHDSEPTRAETLHVRKHLADTGSSRATAAQAYWNRAVPALASWDSIATTNSRSSLVARSNLMLEGSMMDDQSSWDDFMTARNGKNRTADSWHAMQQAAALGHQQAQLYVAHTLTAGFGWTHQSTATVSEGLELQLDDPMLHSLLFDGDNQTKLVLQESWIESSQTQSPQHYRQQVQAWLYWYMSAKQGNVEAMLALGHRMDRLRDQNPSSFTCQDVLPYYQEAANAIIDELEVSPLRAKVMPPWEAHDLSKVHLYGGTSSKLDYVNKPDEKQEALQFYHARATQKSLSSSKNAADVNAAAQAAYKLGNLYQFGIKGVEQNLTLAISYYELAALAGHWEAAGQAGKMFLWGMGVPQDAYKAHKMFRIGMPWSVETCHRKYEQKQARARLQKHKEHANTNDPVYLCEDQCLNGMGLLRLLGLPMIVSLDVEIAERLFILAKEQGNIDARYNLAMMKLGWKTHFQSIHKLEDSGQTSLEDSFFPMSQLVSGHPTQAEYNSILMDLMEASRHKHVQAKHRLALLHAEGVRIMHKGNNLAAVSKDCEKSLKHFQWVTENASPWLSLRMRAAYKRYTAGDEEGALKNYLAAAETGSELAQRNAAFLLERGTCLGLSKVNCAKAAVRLWKAAADKGHVEANVRVGDFYYYGRFREERSFVGPFGWIHYLLYPEDGLRDLLQVAKELLRPIIFTRQVEREGYSDDSDESVCEIADDSTDSACPTSSIEGAYALADDEHSLEKDLSMAVRYYRSAVERSGSARANFNLGFLYEWGLGVKQDFPLAKRHYDNAVAGLGLEAQIPVSIALYFLRWHQWILKQRVYAGGLWSKLRSEVQEERGRQEHSTQQKENIPTPSIEKRQVGQPIPGPNHLSKTRMDVIVSHVFSWESALILVLTVLLSFLLRIRPTPR